MEVELSSDEEVNDDVLELPATLDEEKIAEVNRLLETETAYPFRVEEAINIAIDTGNNRLLQYLVEDPFWKEACDSYCKTWHRRDFIKRAVSKKRARIANYLIEVFSKERATPLYFAGVNVMRDERDELIELAFSVACEHDHSYAVDLIKQGEITQFTKQHLHMAIEYWEKGSNLFEYILKSHQIDPTSGYDGEDEPIPEYFPFVLAINTGSPELYVRILTFLLREDFMQASFQAHGTRINPGFHDQFLLKEVSSLGDEESYDDNGPIDLSFIRYLFQENRLLIPKYQSTNANPDTTWGIDPDSPFQPNVLNMFARYGTKKDHDVLIGDSFRFAYDSFKMNWIGRRNGIPDPNDSTHTTYNLPIPIAVRYNQPEVVQWWLDRFVTKTSSNMFNSQWILLFESAVQYGRADNLEVLYTNYKKQYDLVASVYQPYQQSPNVLTPANLHWVKTFDTQKHELMVRMFDGFLKPVDTTPPGEIMDETYATYGYGIEPNFTHVMVLLLVWGWVDQIKKVYNKLPSKLKHLTDDGSRVFLNINPRPLLLYGTLYNYPIGRFCQRVEAKVKQENMQEMDLAIPKQIHTLYQALVRNPPDVDEQFIQYHLGHLDPLEAQAWAMYYLFVVVHKKQFTVKLFMQLATDTINIAFQTYLSRGGAVVLAKFRQSEQQQPSQPTSFQQQYRPDGWDANSNSWTQCVPCTENEFQKYEALYQETGSGNPCRFTRTKCNEHIGQSRKRKLTSSKDNNKRKK